MTPHELDALLARGWRHFGAYFFRYSLTELQGQLQWVVPLRVRTADFARSRSQRRVWSRNADLTVTAGPARIDAEREDLFARHRTRFHDNVPESLDQFVEEDSPCACVEFAARLGRRLVAASYLDAGGTAVSSVYGIFDPEFGARSLGIFTMLVEIEWARSRGMRYYYPGYATETPSSYDYKKRFGALERYDWVEWRDAQ